MEKSNTNGKAILFILLFGLIFIVGCTNNTQVIPEKNSKNSNENSNTLHFETISTGSTQSGDVLIELTPKEKLEHIEHLEWMIQFHKDYAKEHNEKIDLDYIKCTLQDIEGLKK